MREIATSRPRDFRLPLTTWSLRKLADFLVSRRMVTKTSANMLGRILRENGVVALRDRRGRLAAPRRVSAERTHTT